MVLKDKFIIAKIVIKLMSNIGFVELCEEFFELEDELGLLSRQIQDVYFWERIRVPVHDRLRRVLMDSRDTNETADTQEYLSAGWLLMKNLLVKNPFVSKDNDFLFYGTGRRKKHNNGMWWDIYHDPIVESLENDCLLWERPYNIGHSTPAKTSNLRYVDLVEYTGTLLQKTGLSEITLSEEERTFLNTVEDEIDSRFDVTAPLQSMVTEDLSKRRVRLPLYRKLIRRIEPKSVFIVNSYYGRETFVEACQLEGIPVIELQHGAIGKYHMGYSFPYHNKHIFPDNFFSFGNFWSNFVDLPLPDARIYSVGYPYLEQKVREYDDIKPAKQTIFISQKTIGEELSRFAVKVDRLEKYNNDIIYKLHPSEYDVWKQRYPWLANTNIQVVDSSNPPLYRLFAESKAQVGVSSTAVYEGLNFNLKTYIFDNISGNYMLEPLNERGYANFVNKPEDLVNKNNINNCSDFDKEPFFKSNPINNIKEILRHEIVNDRFENC